MSTYYDIEQNSEEWYKLRSGKFTASKFSDLGMKENTIGYKKAIYQCAFERLYGKTPSDISYSNKAMEWGKDYEPFAREWYERENFLKVGNGGLFELDEWTSCSPDGLVGDDGLIEIKCVYFNTFINYKINGVLPAEYVEQVQGQLWITGRKWLDFIGFHIDVENSNFVTRIYPDQTIINQIKLNVNKAVELTKNIIAQLKK